MDRNINAAYVHVIKNAAGFFNSASPANTRLDCRSRFLGNVTLNTTTHGTECGSWEQGDEHAAKNDMSTDTIATVKMSRYLNGSYSDIYITPSDYTSFVTTCNACCTS